MVVIVIASIPFCCQLNVNTYCAEYSFCYKKLNVGHFDCPEYDTEVW